MKLGSCGGSEGAVLYMQTGGLECDHGGEIAIAD